MRDELLDPALLSDDAEHPLGPLPEDDGTAAPVDLNGLRPRDLDEFVGQAELKNRLRIILEAARRRGQAADHLLFAGPPGLGKTTLAGIVANEMGVQMHITSGPTLDRAGDLAAILTKLGEGDVLFIDEIHRLGRAVEEVLYPAVEDFQLDIVLGKGPAARSIRLDLPRFIASAWWPASSSTRPPISRRSSRAPRASSRPTSTPEDATRSPVAAGARRASRTACSGGFVTLPRSTPTG